MNTIMTILTAASIPSAVAGMFFWWLKRKIAKNEEKRGNEERARKELEMVILDNLNATMTLAEATARAIQRIPDAKCNGDMHAALDTVAQVKEKQRKFLTREGLDNIL